MMREIIAEGLTLLFKQEMKNAHLLLGRAIFTWFTPPRKMFLNTVRKHHGDCSIYLRSH